MNCKKHTTLLLIITFCLLLSCFPFTSSYGEIEKKDSFEIYPNYTEHGSIIIDSDDDFNTYGFSGNGSYIEPYLISNLNITTTNDTSISIYNTTYYFRIENCLLSAKSNCILLQNVSIGTALVQNNFCRDITEAMGTGIKVVKSSSTIIHQNTIQRVGNGLFGCGIMLLDSPSSNISDNELYKDGGFGIRILNSSYSSISMNNITECDLVGLRISSSSNLTVSDNYIYNSGYAYFTSSAMELFDIHKSVIEKNYLKFSISGIDLQQCSDIICRNNEIDECGNVNFGIRFSERISITSNIFANARSIYPLINVGFGMVLYSSNFSSIVSNQFLSNEIGVSLKSSNSCNFVSNIIQDNVGYGAQLDQFSNSNLLYHNIFINNNLDSFSQACDNGTNTWFDSNSKEGNYWSDWSGMGSYSIDGITGVTDPFPLDEDFIPEYSRTIFIPLLFCIFPILTILLRRQKRNN